MSRHAPVRRQRGFSIVTAIFLLVVLAALAAAMVNLSTAQHTGAAIDVQSARAYQAARSGVEWGVYQSLRLNACAGSTVLTLPGTSFTGFTVEVNCVQTVNGGVTTRQISALACNRPACPATGPGPDYVEREVLATLEQ